MWILSAEELGGDRLLVFILSEWKRMWLLPSVSEMTFDPVLDSDPEHDLS